MDDASTVASGNGAAAGAANPRLCACGSGLRPLRCCSQDIATIGTAGASRHIAPLAERAAKAHAEGDVAEATILCLDVLELAPGQPQALRLLYEIRKATHPAAALALLKRLVTLYPNDFWATNELTLLLLNRGAAAEAETHARNAVRIAPENAQSHHLMGMIMTEVNRPQIGEYHYRRAIELAGTPGAILLANMAWNLKNQGKMAEARDFYERSTAIDATILQTLLGWARLEEADRDFAAAADLLDRAEAVSPDNQSILLSRAVLHGRTRAYEAALDELGAIATRRGDGRLGPNELLEKGRLLDQMGRHPDAFEAFVEGKRLVREVSGVAYLADHAASVVGRLKSFFTAPRLKITPRAGVRDDSPQPIFIFGFPRSGTTLVEQTLSAHPAICAGDELPFIADITAMMPRMLNSPLAYPEALAELWMGDQREGLDNLRDYYLQRARQSGILEPGAAWFTDKMPLNETHLGLIALLFPASPMIHVLRHPLDVVLSVFSNQLTHGFYCAYSLETAARHYALIADLVAHYRAEMSLKYLPIRYEDIVADQAGAVGRMLDFIGEDFDDRCLNFQDNKRYARTASYAQVTEKLYDRSRFRYRRYLEELAPVIPILRPAMDRLGYTIDDPEASA
ncbi:MAG TPA: sulfotransferase [Caulobacteraceae bacterium]|nr:sulfotransferase [Caulobacteraceae bacterium]